MSIARSGLRTIHRHLFRLTLVTLGMFATEGWATSVDWVDQMGTSGSDSSSAISIDGLGSVYITGVTTGGLEGSNIGGNDAFVSRYDDTGSLLWTRQFGTTSNDLGRGVAADGLGNVFVTGSTHGNLAGTNPGYADTFLRKYDDAGNVLWTKQFGSNSTDWGSSVSIDGSGNVYVSGQSHIGNQSGDAFVRKYDTSGNLLWDEQLEGFGNLDFSLGVSVDNSGNVFIGGGTLGTLSGPPNVDGQDAFLSKYDATGNIDWTRQFSVEEGQEQLSQANGVSADGFGNVYVTGTGTANWTWEEDTASDEDAFIGKYDEAGNLLWMTSLPGDYGGPDEVQNTATSLSTDGLGNVYVSGSSWEHFVSNGNSDVFVHKYSSAGTLLWTQTLGTTSPDGSSGVSVDGMGNVFITGGTAGSLEGVNAGSSDVFVAKIGPPVAPIDPGTGVTGGLPGSGGGTQDPGGLSVTFDDVTVVGELSGDYMEASSSEVSAVLEAVETGASNINFEIATDPVQFWEIDFTGEFINQVELTLAYDDTNLLPGQTEDQLQVHHFVDDEWEVAQKTGQDLVANTITILTDSFSPFMLGGAVPEPSTIALAGFTLASLGLLTRRRR